MALDTQQVKTLLRMVAGTRDDEVDCDACLMDLAEFAELELVGAEIPVAMERIRAHLEICGECTEEYRALLDVVTGSS